VPFAPWFFPEFIYRPISKRPLEQSQGGFTVYFLSTAVVAGVG
jgi:hypothetical protein